MPERQTQTVAVDVCFFAVVGFVLFFGLLASERERERERERSLLWRSDHHHHPSSFGEGLGVDEGSSSVLEDVKQIVIHL